MCKSIYLLIENMKSLFYWKIYIQGNHLQEEENELFTSLLIKMKKKNYIFS